MKTADIPGKVPTLEEVRDEVVRAWKMREAGKLALKRAEELAKKAQEKGGSLADAIAGDTSRSDRSRPIRSRSLRSAPFRVIRNKCNRSA